MTQYYDEFSAFTTADEIFDFIEQLVEQGINEEIELYEKCIEKFGKYFYTIPLYLD